jgi:hypothetical protein
MVTVIQNNNVSCITQFLFRISYRIISKKYIQALTRTDIQHIYVGVYNMASAKACTFSQCLHFNCSTENDWLWRKEHSE